MMFYCTCPIVFIIRSNSYLTLICRHPGKVVVSQPNQQPSHINDNNQSNIIDDDDFFNNWDKPSKSTPATNNIKPSTPPILGRSSSNLTTVSSVNSDSSTNVQPSNTPRTISSSSLKQPTNTNTRKPTSSKLGASKFGAKKTNTTFNYDEAQKKAEIENERLKNLKIEQEQKQKEELERKQNEEKELIAKQKIENEKYQKSIQNSNNEKTIDSNNNHNNSRRTRLGFGQTASFGNSNAGTSMYVYIFKIK